MDREETVVKKRKYKVQDREEDRGKGLRAEVRVWLQANRLGFSDSITKQILWNTTADRHTKKLRFHRQVKLGKPA